VINRLQPTFVAPDTPPSSVPADLPADLIDNLRTLNSEAATQESHLEPLARAHPDTPILRLPALPELVDAAHDTLGALSRLGSLLELPD
jgi:hypothetical protein